MFGEGLGHPMWLSACSCGELGSTTIALLRAFSHSCKPSYALKAYAMYRGRGFAVKSLTHRQGEERNGAQEAHYCIKERQNEGLHTAYKLSNRLVALRLHPKSEISLKQPNLSTIPNSEVYFSHTCIHVLLDYHTPLVLSASILLGAPFPEQI